MLTKSVYNSAMSSLLPTLDWFCHPMEIHPVQCTAFFFQSELRLIVPPRDRIILLLVLAVTN